MILIIDFGGQLTLVIQRVLRDLHVRCRIVPIADIIDMITKGQMDQIQDAKGIILSGGPNSVLPAHLGVVGLLMDRGTPILGICYGHQLLAQASGAEVNEQTGNQYGQAGLWVFDDSDLFFGIPKSSIVWMSHGDSVSHLPMDWRILAETRSGDCTAIGHSSKPWFGVQFHPEATHTDHGQQMLQNFALNICGVVADYSTGNLVKELESHIRTNIGPEAHLLIACSGGVDSTTLTYLCQLALGPERIHPVFINNGLLRKEDDDMLELVRRDIPQLQIFPASVSFLPDLIGVSDSEEKRRLIGTAFWNVFEAAAKVLGINYPITAFSQGTISPDVIESGGSSSETAVIKKHHNLVQRPASFPFEPFEPLRDFQLFKQQVRAVAKEVGVPDPIVSRHPFPGPGLAVRIRGPISVEKLELARAVDAIWINELRQAGYYDKTSQAGAVVLADTSVCQRGDDRAVLPTIQLWAHNTIDYMTTDVTELPASLLKKVATRISNEVKGAGRVGYNYSSKPPATMEWE